MIKFFRNVRSSLIQENNMGKYFKYAIGEILLVVVGILIALQINNWNEARKKQNLEKRYIAELIFDLRADSLMIAQLSEQSNLQFVAKQKLIDYFNQEKSYTKDSLSQFFNLQWQLTYSFNPITTTLDEMKSTGNIGVIQNSDLRRNILETYNNYQFYTNNHERIYNGQQEEIWKLLFSEVPNLYTGSSKQINNTDIIKVLSNFEVRNRLFGNYVTSLNMALRDLSQWNSDLIKALQDEANRVKRND